MEANESNAPFRRGEVVELVVDVNAIPAGKYQFVEQIDQILMFRLGVKAFIGMTTTYLPFMRKVGGCEKECITLPEFEEKMYVLSTLIKNLPSQISDGFSFCLLHPSVARRLKNKRGAKKNLLTMSHLFHDLESTEELRY